ncbi:MAG: tetratricopeptide repeat protein [Gemmatimonadales bacterium]
MAMIADPATTEPFSDEQPILTPQRLRLLAIIGGVVAVVALVAWFMITAGNRKEAFAAQAVEEARAAAEQGNLPLAVQQFEQVATTYTGTAAAFDATLGMVQARLVNDQSELAIATLTEFLGNNPPDTYAAPANGLLGTAYENTGKFGDALAAYRKASGLATTDYLKATYLLDAGRAARLAGDATQATAIYREIIDTYGETAATTEARVRLAELNLGVI